MHTHSHDVHEGRELWLKTEQIAADAGLRYRIVAGARPEVLGSGGLFGLQRSAEDEGETSM